MLLRNACPWRARNHEARGMRTLRKSMTEALVLLFAVPVQKYSGRSANRRPDENASNLEQPEIPIIHGFSGFPGARLSRAGQSPPPWT
jgi:hypothetical protein